MFHFTPRQYDAIGEIFNLSVGQAAATMSKMVGEEVLLTVQEIRLHTLAQARAQLQQNEQRICGVQQEFEGGFAGRALLVLPEARSLELIRLMIGKNMPIEYLTELEQDALAEVGNIILNACLTSLSDLFGQAFQCGLPSLRIGSNLEVLQQCDTEHLLMLLHIQFTLAQRKIDGFVVLAMKRHALDLFSQALNQFIDGIAPNTNQEKG